MKKKIIRMLAVLLTGALIVGLFSACSNSSTSAKTDSQEKTSSYPKKQISMIIGFDAGTSADTSGRILAKLSEPYLGQSINIVNKPGTSGAMSYQDIRSAKNDGYTIGMGTVTLITHSQMGTIDFSYEDLTPIVTFQTDPAMLFVSSAAPFSTWDEMVSYSKANPGKVNVAVSSVGGLTNIFGQLIEKALGVDWNLVTGSGGGIDGVTQAAGGHVDMAVASPKEGHAFVGSGDITPLCISTEERVNLYPDTPTCKELKYDVTIGNIRGFFGPKNMDPEQVKILRTAFDKAIETDEFKESLKNSAAALLHLDEKGTKELFAKTTKDLIPILKK